MLLRNQNDPRQIDASEACQSNAFHLSTEGNAVASAFSGLAALEVLHLTLLADGIVERGYAVAILSRLPDLAKLTKAITVHPSFSKTKRCNRRSAVGFPTPHNVSRGFHFERVL